MKSSVTHTRLPGARTSRPFDVSSLQRANQLQLRYDALPTQDCVGSMQPARSLIDSMREDIHNTTASLEDTHTRHSPVEDLTAITLDTPETVRHDDTECSTVDISDVSYLDMNDTNFPAEATLVDDPMPSDTEADSIRYADNNSLTSDDTDVVCDSGSHDVDDPRVNHDSTPPYDVTSNITEWEPPPGWCLACWFKDPEKCLKHS